MSDTKNVDIRALAKLARLEMSEEEMNKLEGQIPAILSFVARIQEVAADVEVDKDPEHKNVMREDGNPHESGIFSEKLLSAAPKREGDYIEVPQVIRGGKHV